MKDDVFHSVIEPVIRDTNRSALLIAPKEIYLNWAECVITEESAKLKGQDLFLVPQFETKEDAMRFIQLFYDLFFQFELKKWCVSQAFWPTNRSFEMFSTWFEWSLIEPVKDSMITPVLRESENDFEYVLNDHEDRFNAFEESSEGFLSFDDNGCRSLHASFLPKPGLCLACKKDYDEDEEVYCEIIRMEQNVDESFHCYGYDPL